MAPDRYGTELLQVVTVWLATTILADGGTHTQTITEFEVRFELTFEKNDLVNRRL